MSGGSRRKVSANEVVHHRRSAGRSEFPGLPANMVPRFPGQHGDGLLPTPVHFPFGPVPPAL